jgi:DNA-binding transcriptional MerR regulator/methylmalonyl-CoA mutase cobalamin-binding subunit
MYTIKHAAELTGLPEATLRAWERRYGVVVPLRTEGGYRLYDDDALAALRAMRDLVADGWSARQAADHVRSQGPAGSQRPGAAPADAAVDGPTDGSVDLGPAGAADLLTAAADMSPARLAAILDDRFSRGSFETVVDEWLMPALVAVGEAWAAGTLSTAAEHLTAHAVLRRLSAAFEAAAHSARGPSVLVGLPPGCRHELGALAFATAARRAGLSVAYVGADLPVASWLDAVAHGRPRAIVLAVPRRRDVAAATSVMTAVHDAYPDVRVAVGGGLQDLVAEPAEPLGHRIGDAADRLARELADAPVAG